MIQNDPKRPKTTQNGPKRPNTAQHGPKRLIQALAQNHIRQLARKSAYLIFHSSLPSGSCPAFEVHSEMDPPTHDDSGSDGCAKGTNNVGNPQLRRCQKPSDLRDDNDGCDGRARPSIKHRHTSMRSEGSSVECWEVGKTL